MRHQLLPGEQLPKPRTPPTHALLLVLVLRRTAYRPETATRHGCFPSRFGPLIFLRVLGDTQRVHVRRGDVVGVVEASPAPRLFGSGRASARAWTVGERGGWGVCVAAVSAARGAEGEGAGPRAGCAGGGRGPCARGRFWRRKEVIGCPLGS